MGKQPAADLALDVGTAATRLHGLSRTGALSRPSVVWRSGSARHALRGGVVVEPELAAAVVGDLLRCVAVRRPRALACVPSDATPAERAALVEAVLRAGAGSVRVVPEPLAAAVGARLADGRTAHAVVDVGEGVTDCAVVRGDEVATSCALRVGVADLRRELGAALRRESGVRVSPIEAERVLREIGIGPHESSPRELRIVGTPQSGVGPVIARVAPEPLWSALAPLAGRITAHVVEFLERLPAELGLPAEAARACLSGGGALLRGLPERIAAQTRLPLARAHAPLLAVIEGAARIASGAVSSPAR